MAEACPVDGPVACCAPADPRRVAAWWRIGVGALVAVNSMTVDLALNTTESLPADREIAHAVTLAATAITLALLGWPLLRAAVRELARRRITLEAMFVTGIVGAFTASLVAMLSGEGAVYFEVVSILLVVYAVGQQVTGAAQDRALAAARALAPGLAECEVLGEDGSVQRLPVAALRAGMRVRVSPGAVIPVDGVVERGEGFVREAEMTGELFAAARTPGDAVWAGTGCIDAQLVVRATADGGERRIDRILEAIERARAEPSSLQRRADRVAAWFLPAVVAVAAATFAGWTLASGWATGLFNAMAVLLIACPCAVGLATPLAAWVAIAALGRRGLLVRGGEAVEGLGSVATVVFDKTGTLTERRARLVALVPAAGGSLDEDALHAMLEAVERRTDHPVATAFHGLAGPAAAAVDVADVRLLPGAGVEARVRFGRLRAHLRVGLPERLFETGEQRTAWAELRRSFDAAASAREIAVLVDGRLAAGALVGEEVRETWPAAFAALRRLGLRTVVMTGDLAARAARLGIADVHAGLAPDDKLRLVRGLQAGERGGDGSSKGAASARGRQGGVAFVGDGVNDAAAMAAAAVSVAVAEGAEVATEIADVTWVGGDLRVIPWAIGECRRAVRTIRTNLAFAFAYNAAGVTLAAAGLLHPVVAALLMTGSSLLVTLRAVSGSGAEDVPDGAPPWRGAGPVRVGPAEKEAP